MVNLKNGLCKSDSLCYTVPYNPRLIRKYAKAMPAFPY